MVSLFSARVVIVRGVDAETDYLFIDDFSISKREIKTKTNLFHRFVLIGYSSYLC